MYFKSTTRINPTTGEFDGYYRLVESYRNLSENICNRTLLNMGFLPGVHPNQLNQVKNNLNDRIANQHTLFKSDDPVVEQLSLQLWNRLITEKQLDIPPLAHESFRVL